MARPKTKHGWRREAHFVTVVCKQSERTHIKKKKYVSALF